MKKLFLIALLGAMPFVSCQNDDDATTRTFKEKTAEQPLNLSFSVSQTGNVTVYNYGATYVVQKT